MTLLRQIANRIASESASLDAQVLLAHITGKDRAWVLSHPEVSLTAEQESALETAIRQLQDGVPLPYVLDHWEFFGLDFDVTPDVLIPRPETELLIETILRWVQTNPRPAYRFLDVGTGSGCIPVALAVHVPHAEIVATDISPAALAVARRNAEKHGVGERITFIECDLLPADRGRWTMDGDLSTVDGLPSTVNILTANLPYIPTETLKDLPIYHQEPIVAMDGGADGLDLIRRLLAKITGKMMRGSLILLEIETRQGLAVSALARGAFPGADIQIKIDLAGHDRLVRIET
jgi:release factor glutamine methyltransferase